MKILIIDDEINLLKSLKTILELNGHVVDSCESEKSGLQHIQDNKYDALLLDLFVETEDSGFKILKKLNNKGVTAIEYGLIAALIGVAIITAVTNTGTAIQGTFNTVEGAL